MVVEATKHTWCHVHGTVVVTCDSTRTVRTVFSCAESLEESDVSLESMYPSQYIIVVRGEVSCTFVIGHDMYV